MFYRSFHQLVFPVVFVTVVGSVWIAAWSEALQAEAEKGTWPALPIQDREDRPANTADPSSQSKSLQQVLLEHDQVVGMR